MWHCRALYSWLHNLRALALLPHPPSEHWLWGNAQALTRPDFHRRMLQYATEFGAIFSMRLIWFKVRSANSGSRPGPVLGFCVRYCVSWRGRTPCSRWCASQVVVVCDPLLVAPLLSRNAALDKPFACKAFAEGYFPISVVCESRRGAGGTGSSSRPEVAWRRRSATARGCRICSRRAASPPTGSLCARAWRRPSPSKT